MYDPIYFPGPNNTMYAHTRIHSGPMRPVEHGKDNEHERVAPINNGAELEEDQEEDQMEPQTEGMEEEINEDEALKADDELDIEVPEYHLIPVGPCKFVISRVRILRDVETPFGVKNRIQLTFNIKKADETGEIREWPIRRSFNVSANENSSLMKFHDQIRCPRPTKILHCRDYLGITGDAEIKYATLENGNTIAVIENFSVNCE